jgi:hypothetical protein
MNAVENQFSPNRGASRSKFLSVGLVAISLLIGAGCATSTQAPRASDAKALASVRSLDVCVKVDNEFTVMIARERISTTGAAIAGGIGYGIESSVLATKDEKEAQKLRPLLDQFDCRGMLQERSLGALKKTGLFSNVQAVSEAGPATVGSDARLSVILREWSLRPCMGATNTAATTAATKVEVTLWVDASLISAKGKPLWKGDVDCRQGKGRPLAEYQATPGLLTQELAQAIDRVSTRIAREIQFPQ